MYREKEARSGVGGAKVWRKMNVDIGLYHSICNKTESEMEII